MGKKHKRRKVGPPGPEHFKARASGKVIVVGRGAAIAELLDTAIWLWFLERDPLSIHVLAVAAYNCLEALGKDSGKGPVIKSKIGAEKFDTAYDFLRHASSNPLTGIDFPPSHNGPIMFDAITSFARIFNGYVSLNMEAFRAYFAIHSDLKTSTALLEHAEEFLPKGITLQEARSLGRQESLEKLVRLFAIQGRSPRSYK
jgi:hypothetical protein